MKAFLIDPYSQTISEVEYNGDYRQIYSYIDADCFDAPIFNREGDSVFVDGEGRMHEPKPNFLIDGYPDPLAGKGLVLGLRADGESISPSITLADLKLRVSWVYFVYDLTDGSLMQVADRYYE